jgi:DNA segregation ATPase FtsK/SpoIIIE-like protein
MARKKIVKKSVKNSEANGKDKAQTDSGFIRQIWGLVYLSIGVLLLISMIFYSHKQLTSNPGGAEVHILGPYFGTSLALGMYYLFGRIAAFMFAGAVCYIGAARLMGWVLRLKLLLFIVVLIIEFCLLLAIRHMPELKANGLMPTANITGSNLFGLLMANALVPLFGGRVFGPYFIGSLLMAITVMVGLRIKPQSIISFVSRWFMVLISWIRRAFAEIKAGIKNSPDIRSERPAESTAAASKYPIVGADTPNAAPESPAQDTAISPIDIPIPDSDADANKKLTPEEEAKKRLEDELSEFRKKKVEDVKILTRNTPDTPPDTDEEGIPPLSSPTGASSKNEDYDILEDIPVDSDQPDDEDNENDDEFKVTDYVEPAKPYIIPSPDILPEPPPLSDAVDEEAIKANIKILENTLMNFGVEGKVVFVNQGPVVIRYEIELAPGVRLSKVKSLQDDISMAVGGQQVRILAPIPGKAAIGIELPNPERQVVHFKHVLVSNKFKKSKAAIPIVIGSDISGGPYITDIAKTPHLLIAGQTGAGKSVCINSLICSILMTKKPDELRLIMIDPKMVEFASYESVPHLLSPVVTEPAEAVKALQWGVREMERRYKLLSLAGVQKIDDFNSEFETGALEDVLPEDDKKRLPLIVIIIDELADLMMTASKDVEKLIMRITQKARAAGIHLIVATQRPSVDVITGPIKANLPSRIAFRTVQSNDSRTILDQGGAEKLLGMGDMLFLLNGEPDVERFHGAFISGKDVKAIVTNIKNQQISMERIDSFHDLIDDSGEGGGSGSGDGDGSRDEHFFEAARIVVETGIGSTSLLQRRLEIGFARAGRLMDQLERAGVVGPAKGSKAREVKMLPEDLSLL